MHLTILWLSCRSGSQQTRASHWTVKKSLEAEIRRNFMTTTVRDRNPTSHHKGATGRVRTGDQLFPVLCHCQLGQDIPTFHFFNRNSKFCYYPIFVEVSNLNGNVWIIFWTTYICTWFWFCSCVLNIRIIKVDAVCVMSLSKESFKWYRYQILTPIFACTCTP